MNTTLKITAAALATAVVVGAFALVGAGLAQAQGGTPWGNPMGAPQAYSPNSGGYGMMGGPGYPMRGNGAAMVAGVDVNAMHSWMTATGGMHTVVWNEVATTLGLSPEALNTELASGKTLAQVAETQGVSQEALTAALQSAIKSGLDQAVADGVLTQTRADLMLAQMTANSAWMGAHMGGMGGGFGPGRQAMPVTP